SGSGLPGNWTVIDGRITGGREVVSATTCSAVSASLLPMRNAVPIFAVAPPWATTLAMARLVCSEAALLTRLPFLERSPKRAPTAFERAHPSECERMSAGKAGERPCSDRVVLAQRPPAISLPSALERE